MSRICSESALHSFFSYRLKWNIGKIISRFSLFFPVIIVNMQMRRFSCQNFQIFGAIVAFVFVDVVNDFTVFKFSTVCLFPNVAMKINPSAVHANLNVKRFAFASVKFGKMFAQTFSRANFLLSFLEQCATDFTVFHNSKNRGVRIHHRPNTCAKTKILNGADSFHIAIYRTNARRLRKICRRN